MSNFAEARDRREGYAAFVTFVVRSAGVASRQPAGAPFGSYPQGGHSSPLHLLRDAPTAFPPPSPVLAHPPRWEFEVH